MFFCPKATWDLFLSEGEIDCSKCSIPLNDDSSIVYTIWTFRPSYHPLALLLFLSEIHVKVFATAENWRCGAICMSRNKLCEWKEEADGQAMKYLGMLKDESGLLP